MNFLADSHSRSVLGFACVSLSLVFATPALGPLDDSPLAAGDEKTAWLGVSVQEVTPELSDALDLGLRAGVLVTDVAPDSPAEWAGLRKEDVILELNRRPVRDPAALVATIRGYRPGERVRLLIWRYGDEHIFRVKLGSRPSSGASAPDADVTYPRPPAIPDIVPGLPPVPDVIRGMPPGLDAEADTSAPGASMLPELARLFTGLKGPTLGVNVVPVNPGLARYFDARPDEGLLIVDVLPESAAQKAGLESGDIILRVNGKTVSSADELRRCLRDAEDMDVRVTIQRDGSEQNVRVELPAVRQHSELRRETDRLGREYRQRLRPALRDHLLRFRRNLDDVDSSARRELERLHEEVDQLREELRALREELREDVQDLKSR